MGTHNLSNTYPWSSTKATLKFEVKKTLEYSDGSSKEVIQPINKVFTFIKNNTKEPKTFTKQYIYEDEVFICNITQEGMGDGVISYKVYVVDYPTTVAWDVEDINVSYAVDEIETLADGTETIKSNNIYNENVHLSKGQNTSMSSRRIQETFEVSVGGETKQLMVDVLQLGNLTPQSIAYAISITYPLSTTIVPYTTTSVTANYTLKTIAHYQDGSTAITQTQNLTQVKEIGDNSARESRPISDTITYESATATWSCKQAGGKDIAQTSYLCQQYDIPTVDATDTTANITYKVDKTVKYQTGEESTSEEIKRKNATVFFSPNTTEIATSATGTYMDASYGNVQWTVYQNAATQPSEKYLIKITYTNDKYFTSTTDSVTSAIVTKNNVFPPSEVKSVEMLNGIKSIMASAFYNCRNLTSITIPNSVTSIGQYAFQNCQGITSVTYNNTVYTCQSELEEVLNKNMSTVGTDAFQNTNLNNCEEPPSEALIVLTLSNGETVNITSTTATRTDISNPYANRLVKAELKNRVTSISESAFYNCTQLTSVTIANSVTSIGNSAFGNCEKLTQVNIPNSVTNMGIYVFGYCTSLTSVTLSNALTQISEGTFNKCSKLPSITISNKIKTIGNSAFGDCTSLASVTYNGSSYTCQATLEETLENQGVTLGETVFDNTHLIDCEHPTSALIVLTLRDGTTVDINSATATSADISDKYDNTLVKAELKTGVTTISDDAFKLCTQLTSVTIPNSVTSIGKNAFDNCQQLTSVTIPNQVTTISESAFNYCRSLTSVTIPDNVITIGHGAFTDCFGLTSIILSNNIGQIDTSAFENCDHLTSVTYNGSSYTCQVTLEETLGNQGVTLGNRVFDNTHLIDCEHPTSALIVLTLNDETTVEINKTVAISGDISQKYSTTLVKAELNKGVTEISGLAFSSCGVLSSVTLSDTIEHIDNHAFIMCFGLTNITIPDSVTHIDKMAFFRCSGLTTVTLGNGIEVIGDSAFRQCSGFVSLTIPDSIKEIKINAFTDCTNLSSVVYNGQTYTCKDNLERALKSNGVEVGLEVFVGTNLICR